MCGGRRAGSFCTLRCTRYTAQPVRLPSPSRLGQARHVLTFCLVPVAGFVAVALIHSPPINLPSPFMLPVPLHIPLAASFPASPREHQPAELASVNSTWAVTEDDYEIVEHLICSAYLPLLVTVLAADMGANCWRLLMYVDLIVVYHNPFLPNTARPLYHVAVLLAAVFWGLAISDTDVLCTTADASGSLNLQTLTWGLVYAPFFLFVVCGGGLYAAVAWLLSRDEQHRPISLLARQRVMQHCLLYLLLYGLLFGALAAAYANFRLFEQIGQSFFVHAVAALTAGRPAFAFLGWLLINRVPQRVACSACRGSDGPQPNFLPMLKQPLMAEAHLPGAGWLHRLSKTRGMHGGAGRASSGAWAVEGSETAADSVLISTNSHDSTASEMRGAGEVGFKEELRYELVLDVTRAIAELAEREAVPQPPPPERAAGGDVSTCAASSATGSVAASVAGAGFAAAAAGPATPKDERACNEWDVLHSPRRSLASMAGLTPQQPQPHVQHYAVAHFRAIRAAFGINPRVRAGACATSGRAAWARRMSLGVGRAGTGPLLPVFLLLSQHSHATMRTRRCTVIGCPPLASQEFASAFANSLPELQQSSRLLRESVSEGASGSFFYWVKHPDGRDTGYIVKQVTHREKDVLMSILPAYKEHVQRRNGASLLQYLSCHSMRLRWQWAGKVYFVVMRNFFPIRPQLCFDLKGATANRRALKAWQLHQSNTVAGMYDTLRDWEWMDIGMTTDMDSSDRAVLWETLSADTELLVRQNILDYSLLIGIYRPPATLIPQQKREQMRELVRQCCGTAYVSRDRQKVRAASSPDRRSKARLGSPVPLPVDPRHSI